MSDARLRDIPQLDRERRNLDQFAQSVQEALQTFRGTRGDPLDKALTLRDAVAAGLLQITGGAGGGGGGLAGVGLPPGSTGSSAIDLTPPPTPTGLVVSAGFANLFIEWTAPGYTTGHGHLKTNLYGAKFPTGGPQPTFGDAVRIGEAWDARTLYAHPTELGTNWAIWITFESVDGVESVTPAGGANGVQATIGKIGNADLGPLIVQAANLADSAVDLGTNKVTSSGNFGAIAVGYTVTQYLVGTSGVLGNLLVDNAQIVNLSASKLTVGDGTIGGNLRSTNYVAGSSGWMVQPGGFAEFSNVTIRGATYTGTIYANAGTIGGIVIDPGEIRSSNYVAGVSGFRVNATGFMEVYNLTARGDITANALNAATGTFTGSLSAATGTFAGALTAAAVNAVDSINIAGNAVTIPAGGQAIGVSIPYGVATTALSLGTLDTTVSGVARPLYMHIGFEGTVQNAATGVTIGTYRLKLNSTVIRTYDFSATVASGARDWSRNDPVYVASPPVGAFTITVEQELNRSDAPADSSFTITLFAIGVKR